MFEDVQTRANGAILLSRSAATVISSWSRLETVVLSYINLFCTEDDQCWEEEGDEENGERVSFFGVGGSVPIASTFVRVEWHLTEAWTGSLRRSLGGPVGDVEAWANVLESFVFRDQSLARMASGGTGRWVLVLNRLADSMLWEEVQVERERLVEPHKSAVEIVTPAER